MLAVAFLVVAAVLLAAGAALVFPPAGLIVAGLCVGAAGWELLPDDPGDGR